MRDWWIDCWNNSECWMKRRRHTRSTVTSIRCNPRHNHGEVAAAILKPYVSEKIYWIVKHHPVFQGYYYNHYLGGDRNAREKYRDSPHYDDCIYFCERYDQNAFDPAYDSKPLEFFEPMLRRVFVANHGHMELAERADDKVA